MDEIGSILRDDDEAFICSKEHSDGNYTFSANGPSYYGIKKNELYNLYQHPCFENIAAELRGFGLGIDEVTLWVCVGILILRGEAGICRVVGSGCGGNAVIVQVEDLEERKRVIREKLMRFGEEDPRYNDIIVRFALNLQDDDNNDDVYDDNDGNDDDNDDDDIMAPSKHKDVTVNESSVSFRQGTSSPKSILKKLSPLEPPLETVSQQQKIQRGEAFLNRYITQPFPQQNNANVNFNDTLQQQQQQWQQQQQPRQQQHQPQQQYQYQQQQRQYQPRQQQHQPQQYQYQPQQQQYQQQQQYIHPSPPLHLSPPIHFNFGYLPNEACYYQNGSALPPQSQQQQATSMSNVLLDQPQAQQNRQQQQQQQLLQQQQQQPLQLQQHTPPTSFNFDQNASRSTTLQSASVPILQSKQQQSAPLPNILNQQAIQQNRQQQQQNQQPPRRNNNKSPAPSKHKNKIVNESTALPQYGPFSVTPSFRSSSSQKRSSAALPSRTAPPTCKSRPGSSTPSHFFPLIPPTPTPQQQQQHVPPPPPNSGQDTSHPTSFQSTPAPIPQSKIQPSPAPFIAPSILQPRQNQQQNDFSPMPQQPQLFQQPQQQTLYPDLVQQQHDQQILNQTDHNEIPSQPISHINDGYDQNKAYFTDMPDDNTNESEQPKSNDGNQIESSNEQRI